jgi:hypothetical protein
MSTPFSKADLTKQAPHSPRERFGGFAIIARTTDKCRASIAGTLGEYHYDCPLDNQLFSFKGINGAQFKTAVASAKTYEDVAKWLAANGAKKSDQEIKAWSDKAEAAKLKDILATKSEAEKKEFSENVRRVGVDPETATVFEWLEADDHYTFQAEMAHH